MRAAYLAMELTASFVIVLLACATLLTLIATIVSLADTRTISYFADRAADLTTSSDDLRALC